MSLDPQSGFSQGFINALLGAISTLTTVVVGLIAYIANGWRRKIISIDVAQKEFALKTTLLALETRVSEMTSRKELAAYMLQIREDIQERDQRTREDRAQMHKDNLDRMKELRDDIGGLRTDIRAVHSRVDEVVSSK